METQYFIGIDISKESLNWAVCSANKIILEHVSGNDIKSITKTVLSIQRELKFKIPSAVFCMEHTARAAPRHLSHSLTKILTKSESINLAGVRQSNRGGGPLSIQWAM